MTLCVHLQWSNSLIFKTFDCFPRKNLLNHRAIFFYTCISNILNQTEEKSAFTRKLTQCIAYLSCCKSYKGCTCWQMFLYWYKPSFAMWLFRSSTQSCRYFSIIGSWIFCHVRCFLLLITSYNASRARCFFPTSINSAFRNQRHAYKRLENE